MEIPIYVGKRWKGQEAELAKRVARIISRDDEGCVPGGKNGGYPWQLDERGNDWWMTDIKNGVFLVVYRYGDGHKEMMLGLQKFIQWSLGKLLDSLEGSIQRAEEIAKETTF